jgi:hypothetical protein
VRDVALAEEAGFDFAVISDHYFPWLDLQGHAPYAWSVLGATPIDFTDGDPVEQIRELRHTRLANVPPWGEGIMTG